MQPQTTMTTLQTVGLWAAIVGPLVVLILSVYLNRRFKKADEARAAVAKKAEEDRVTLARKAEEDRKDQMSLLHQIKGAVETHGEQIVAIRTRVDGHDKEFDRLYTGVFSQLNRRTESAR